MPSDRAPIRRTYLDRLGRVITDPETIEARYVQQQLRRLITIGVNAGRPWDAACTVGELARATKLAPERVVEIVRAREPWLWAVTEIEGPIESWEVWQDGE